MCFLQVAAGKEASTAAAAAAEEQRAALQSDLNQSKQRLQAAEKARLELEVGCGSRRTAHCCASTPTGPRARHLARQAIQESRPQRHPGGACFLEQPA